MELFLKLVFGSIGKVFNNPDVPWYYNVMPVLLIFLGIVLITLMIMKLRKKKD